MDWTSVGRSARRAGRADTGSGGGEGRGARLAPHNGAVAGGQGAVMASCATVGGWCALRLAATCHKPRVPNL
eukprot:1806568-Prymnesium_polylepis.1